MHAGGQRFDPARLHHTKVEVGSRRLERNFPTSNILHSTRRNTQVWLKGSVLKTDRRVKPRGGSNPSSSAIFHLYKSEMEQRVLLLSKKRRVVSMDSARIDPDRVFAQWKQALENFIYNSAGWSSLVARRAHNPKVGGSNPSPATKFTCSNSSHT